MDALHSAEGRKSASAGQEDRLPIALSVLVIFALSALSWAVLIATAKSLL